MSTSLHLQGLRQGLSRRLLIDEDHACFSLSPQALETLLRDLEAGADVAKYGHSGTPLPRRLRLSSTRDSVFYEGATRKALGECTLRLRDLDAVLQAIELLGTQGNIGHKQLVFSTVGDERVFARLGSGQVKPALALSLHSTRAELRAQLLPKAPRITPEELVDMGEAYARATGYPIQYQWTLMDGINDSEEEIEGIVRLLKGKYALMNMIPYNVVDGLPYQRPSWERAAQIARTLHQRGILTKLRQSAGQDVEGGCGQLRARALQGTTVTESSLIFQPPAANKVTHA
jgi:hypothetical protein